DAHDEGDHDVGDGDELGVVGRVADAVAGTDALVGGHRDVPAVEGQQRDQVEEGQEDVEGGHEADDVGQGQLAADLDDAQDRDDPLAVLGRRLGRGTR